MWLARSRVRAATKLEQGLDGDAAPRGHTVSGSGGADRTTWMIGQTSSMRAIGALSPGRLSSLMIRV